VPLERKLHLIHPLVDSFIEIALTENGLLVGSEGVIRCDLTFKRPGSTSVSFSSATTPTWFTLAFPSIVNGRALNVIRVNLKDVPDPPANGRWQCNVTIRDALSVGGMTCGAFDVDIQRSPGTAGSVGTGMAALPVAGFNFILGTDDGVTQWQKSVDGLAWSALAVTHIVRRITWIESQSGLTKRYVAVGNGIWYSDDGGASWIAATAPGFSNGQDFGYSIDQEVAVAVSSDGGIWRSTDFGATWSDATSYTSQTFRSVQFDSTVGAGIWVAVASAGNPSTQRAQWSLDGDTWTLTVSDGPVTSPRSVASDELTKFIIIDAITNLNGASQSANGTTWSSAGVTPFGSGDNIDFGHGIFMMNGVDGSSNNIVQRSASGTGSWTTVVVGSAAVLGTSREVQADFTRDRWWHVSRNRLHQSDDNQGNAWTQRATGTFLSCIGIKPA
jgi:hypothetical protein